MEWVDAVAGGPSAVDGADLCGGGVCGAGDADPVESAQADAQSHHVTSAAPIPSATASPASRFLWVVEFIGISFVVAMVGRAGTGLSKFAAFDRSRRSSPVRSVPCGVYHGTGIGDIASRVGIAHGTFYLYFASKRDIVQQVLNDLKMRSATAP